MKAQITIVTSIEISKKVEKIFSDKVLKPDKLKISNIGIISDTSIITIDCDIDTTPSDLFFLGYWTGQLNINH